MSSVTEREVLAEELSNAWCAVVQRDVWRCDGVALISSEQRRR